MTSSTKTSQADAPKKNPKKPLLKRLNRQIRNICIANSIQCRCWVRHASATAHGVCERSSCCWVVSSTQLFSDVRVLLLTFAVVSMYLFFIVDVCRHRYNYVFCHDAAFCCWCLLSWTLLFTVDVWCHRRSLLLLLFSVMCQDSLLMFAVTEKKNRWCQDFYCWCQHSFSVMSGFNCWCLLSST